MKRLPLTDTDHEHITPAIPEGPWQAHFVAIITDESKKMGLCLHPSVAPDRVLDWQGKPWSEEHDDGVTANQHDCKPGIAFFGQDFGCIHFQPKGLGDNSPQEKK
jgi:hypothetical protein